MKHSLVISTVLAVLTVAATVRAQDRKSDVLDGGDTLPKGFESIEASELPGTKWRRIDAVYGDPTNGITIRFTTVRGSKDMAEPGRQPIDVCVRDAKTGELLLDPQIFGATAMIEGCARGAHASESAKKHYPQILEALDLLASVRFKPEYRPEFIALVNQTTRAIPDGQEHTELGGGLIIHKKGPALPAAVPAPAVP
jgi:hypothetical protein